MSQHISRVKNRSIIPVFVLALIAIGFVYFLMEKPRSVLIATIPAKANVYVDERRLCQTTPCKVEGLSLRVPSIYITAGGYNRETVDIDYWKHIFSGEQSLSVKLVEIVKPPVKTYEEPTVTPHKRPKLVEPKPQAPLPPKPRSSVTKIRPECIETSLDRKLYKNRDAEICFADDRIVKSKKSGECYAFLTVTRDGNVESLNYMGCMDDALVPIAKTAFLQRQYLPALENGRPIETIVEAELTYGDKDLKLPNGEIVERLVIESAQVAPSTINRDASITDCPLAPVQHKLIRSGHCITEVDISAAAKITEIRSLKCTEGHLKEAALSMLNQCKISAAISDEKKIERVYYRYKIDIVIYGKDGRPVPEPPAFRARVKHKPYVVFD